MDRERFKAFWEHLERKWRLADADLTPSHLRHFVTTAARKARTDEVGRALMKGHDARSIGIAGQYDAPEDDEDIFDRQRAALPEGALGTIGAPMVGAIIGLDPEAAKAVQAYMNGQLTTAEVAERLDRARTRAMRANSLTPTR